MKKSLLASLSAVALLITGCSSSSDSADSGGEFGSIKVALVPGGAHPYFQPWKDGGSEAVSEFGIGGTEFNETGEWDQTKHNAAIDAMAAQGYNAFGVFGV